MRTYRIAALATAAAALAFGAGAFAQEAQKLQPKQQDEQKAEQKAEQHKHGERGMNRMRGMHERMGARHAGGHERGQGCAGTSGQQGEHEHS